VGGTLHIRKTNTAEV